MSNNINNAIWLFGSLISISLMMIAGNTIYHQKKFRDSYNHKA